MKPSSRIAYPSPMEPQRKSAWHTLGRRAAWLTLMVLAVARPSTAAVPPAASLLRLCREFAPLEDQLSEAESLQLDPVHLFGAGMDIQKDCPRELQLVAAGLTPAQSSGSSQIRLASDQLAVELERSLAFVRDADRTRAGVADACGQDATIRTAESDSGLSFLRTVGCKSDASFSALNVFATDFPISPFHQAEPDAVCRSAMDEYASLLLSNQWSLERGPTSGPLVGLLADGSLSATTNSVRRRYRSGGVRVELTEVTGQAGPHHYCVVSLLTTGSALRQAP